MTLGGSAKERPSRAWGEGEVRVRRGLTTLWVRVGPLKKDTHGRGGVGEGVGGSICRVLRGSEALGGSFVRVLRVGEALGGSDVKRA